MAQIVTLYGIQDILNFVRLRNPPLAAELGIILPEKVMFEAQHIDTTKQSVIPHLTNDPVKARVNRADGQPAEADDRHYFLQVMVANVPRVEEGVPVDCSVVAFYLVDMLSLNVIDMSDGIQP